VPEPVSAPGGPKEIPLTSVAIDFTRLPSPDLAPSSLRKLVDTVIVKPE
jgi:hypothetical protein